MEQAKELSEKLETVSEFTAEIVWKNRRGKTQTPTLMKGSLINNGKNEPAYISITAIDISELKSWEQSLIQSQTELNYAQEIAQMGSWEMDMATGKTQWSENYYRLIGLTPFKESNPEQRFREMVHPDDRHLIEETLEYIKQNRKSTSTELRLIMPDGTIKWIKDNIVPVFEGETLKTLKGVNIDITDLKETKEKFREQNKQLNAIIQAMPDPLYILDSLGVCLECYASENLREAFPGNFNGLPLRDFFTSEDTGIHLKELKYCLENRKLIDYEYSMAFGESMEYYEIRMIPIKDNNVLASVRNITSRKNTEKQILRLSLAVIQSPVAVIITDTKGDIEFINPAFEKITGYKYEEMIGKKIQLPDSKENFEDIHLDLWNTIQSGKMWEKEWLREKKNGELYWEYFTITPIQDETGKTISYLTIKQDISQRKQYEQEIIELNANLEKKIQERTSELVATNASLLDEINKRVESEQKFERAFQAGYAVIAISDFETWKYLEVNNTFTEILGYSHDEVIGRTNEELGIFADKKIRSVIIKSLKKNVPVRKIEALVRKKNGDISTFLLSADTIYIGERRCLLTVSVDITERKKAEEEIRKARREAEEANFAKSEFLSRMSHELRTPMNAILGFAQLLEMGELNPAQKRGVDHILRSGKHLLTLINEVLDISRIEAGRLSLSLEPIRISDIIKEMLDIVRPLAVEHQVSLTFPDSPENNLFIKSDRQSTKQILLNLLSNAIKYNKKGGSVLIKQQISKKGQDAEYVRILVSDTGIGISSENISKLFTPFERVGADKTRIEGTGLGLTVVKKLTEAMGGFIGLESKLNEGSIFWVELPKAQSQLEYLEDKNALPKQNLKNAGKHGTVLYFEDNISNIELLEQILSTQRPDIRLISDMSGTKAVKIATEFQPDLILLDLNLPDIHGSEVLRLLLGNKETRNIPVVIISANAMENEIKRLINAGARKYLTKPIDIASFLNIIDEFTGIKKNTCP